MNLFCQIIGKSSIHPALFYSGKIAGYATWVVLVLQVLGLNVEEISVLGVAEYLSFIFGILGLFMTIWSLINLGSSVRLGLPMDDTKLVTHGLYRISRNPMYTGFNLFTIASMIYVNNNWIIIAGIYSLVIYHLIILAEEKYLEEKHGISYVEYKRKVRRYL